MSIPVYSGSNAYPDPSDGPVVTIGKFDGVHLGHQALIAEAKVLAAELQARVCAYTFHPAPVDVLRPRERPPRIQTLEQRLAALEAVGVDEVVLEPFDRAFSEHDAAWFAREVLRSRLGARAVVVGWDFRFGRGRSGDVDQLAHWLDVPVKHVAPVREAGEVVSSSRIRDLVREGRVDRAAALLSRPHRVTGEVVGGDGRGRGLGFPTANLSPDSELLPAEGVYAAYAWVDERRVPAVANLGTRPTFGAGGPPRLEIHLLDFEGDLYTRRLSLDFVGRIRGEVRFENGEQLARRIQEDVAHARRMLEWR